MGRLSVGAAGILLETIMPHTKMTTMLSRRKTKPANDHGDPNGLPVSGKNAAMVEGIATIIAKEMIRIKPNVFQSFGNGISHLLFTANKTSLARLPLITSVLENQLVHTIVILSCFMWDLLSGISFAGSEGSAVSRALNGHHLPGLEKELSGLFCISSKILGGRVLEFVRNAAGWGSKDCLVL